MGYTNIQIITCKGRLQVLRGGLRAAGLQEYFRMSQNKWTHSEVSYDELK